MSSKKKISISFFVITTLLVILILLSVILTTVFIESLTAIARFTNTENSTNIKSQAQEFLKKGVELEAMEYSTLFLKGSNLSEVIADNLRLELEDFHNAHELEGIRVPNISLKKYKDICYYNINDPSTAYFTFNSGNAQPSGKQRTEIYCLAQQNGFISSALENSNYMHDVWILTKDLSFAIFPNSFKGQSLDKLSTLRNNLQRYLLELNKPDKRKLKSFWSNIHKASTGKLQVTSLAPVINDKNEFLALIGVSIRMEEVLSEILGEGNLEKQHYNKDSIYREFPGAFTFIIDSKCDFVAFPIIKSSLFYLPKHDGAGLKSHLYRGNLNQSDSADVVRLAKFMSNNSHGSINIKIRSKKYIVVFHDLKNKNWKLGVVIPEYDLLKSIRETNEGEIHAKNKIIANILVAVLIIVMFFLLISLVFFKKFIIAPLMKLNYSTRSIIKGNFNDKIDDMNSREMNRLSESLNLMCRNISQYMTNFKVELEKTKKLETEIKVASSIQRSLLPDLKKIQSENIQLSAELYIRESASKCFYDIFKISDGKLALVVADISEKGLPGALFMGMFKTILKNTCLRSKNSSPDRVLGELRIMLAKMEATLSDEVSLFLGYYDLASGEISYCSVGRSVKAYKASTDFIQRLSATTKGTFGIHNTVNFCSETISLSNVDKLILLARELDPGTEEADIHALRSTFEKIIRDNFRLSCEELCAMIKKDVIDHALGGEIDSAALFILEHNEYYGEQNDS